jgi:hypothetical protein
VAGPSGAAEGRLSSAFLVVQGRVEDPGQLRAVCARWLPFVPEANLVAAHGPTHVWAWSVVEEAARGSYWDSDEAGSLVMNGWFQEPRDAPLSRSVAAVMRGLPELGPRLAGDWCAVSVGAGGRVVAASDFLGGAHLYAGERNGRAVVSNRALLAAAALHDGVPPEPDPLCFGWFHTTCTAPLGFRTPFAGVSLVDPTDPPAEPPPTFDQAWTELVARAAQVTRFPGMRFWLTLSGGKDSRLVLASLLAAGARDVLAGCYLEGPDDHPDAIVGRALAGRYGLPFELRPVPGADLPLEERLLVHNHLTELGLNAWDGKAVTRRGRDGDLRGYYGEIYKAHLLWPQRLGWPVVRGIYLHARWLDPHRILTQAARARLHADMAQWLERSRAAGARPGRMADALHRQARMRRWCGQAQQADACGPLALNPLPEHRLAALRYDLPLSDQTGCRIHFELMRRFDDQLWRLPFANWQWTSHILNGVGSASGPVRGDAFQASPQLALWQAARRALAALLLDPSGAGSFFETYRRAGLERLLRRAEHRPTPRRLKAILGAAAVRLALSRPLSPRPLRVEPRPP